MCKICVKHSKYIITKNSINLVENEMKKKRNEKNKIACMNSGSTEKNFKPDEYFNATKLKWKLLLYHRRMKNSVIFKFCFATYTALLYHI